MTQLGAEPWDRPHMTRCSETALRGFFRRLDHGVGYDVSIINPQPFYKARRSAVRYLGVGEWFDRGRMVFPPLVDIVRWNVDAPGNFRLMIGQGDWLGGYHLLLADTAAPLRLVRTPADWIAAVAGKPAARAVCWVGEGAPDFRGAFSAFEAIECADDELAELLYKGLRARPRETFPEVRVPQRAAIPRRAQKLVAA